ncbi:glycosyltransferase family 2 protein [Mucilaginibacter ginsenosidivorans]|uniref:Glycosyltransferase family 2 protein n=1 Tax=Mucilaginibacter ginsenosidivorans TaxID=398053 RepID=A0A5B8V141_9SPHI|nr:glycosyltransferase family 2 protein [Mucilaginibacter ginsenosidivorans]QEC64533.1 glycosyltransferase family 2 protein [Mucilaginibacter ginsenosidivorans]
MTNTPKVAIVILNWNGVKYLRDFLPSVLTSIWPNLDIVVGDNGSTDGSIEFLTQNYPTIRIIKNDQNYGFTGGYNRVLEKVDADYFILLNSDVEVHPGWIEPVISLMESDPLIAAAAPKIKAFADKDHFEHAGAAGGFIDVYGYPFCRGRMFYEIEQDKGQYQQSGEIFWASGAAMFVKKKYWVEAGGFDDRFFAHMEEIDLCWRLKNMGYKVVYCAESEVYHVGGGTLNTENPFKTFLNFRNNLLLLRNNLSFWRGMLIIFIRFWMDLLAIVRFLNEGKRRDAWAVSRAHQNFVLQLFKGGGPKRNRRSNLRALKGMYRSSIVWDFFMKKKHTFSSLDPKKFY